MKILAHVLGAFALLATAAPAAKADEPCDRPAQVEYDYGYRTPVYAPSPVEYRRPVYVSPGYSYRYSRWEARREAERREAYRRWWWRHHHHNWYYDYDR